MQQRSLLLLVMHQSQLAHQMAARPRNGGELWSYGGTTPAIRCCVTLSSLSEGKHRGLFESFFLDPSRHRLHPSFLDVFIF